MVQADRATQELPSLVAPISRGLNAAVERLSLLEHTALKLGDAIQPNDLDKILARCVILCLASAEERKEKTTPFGVSLMRSQVLYRAAQVTSAASPAMSLQDFTCLGL